METISSLTRSSRSRSFLLAASVASLLALGAFVAAASGAAPIKPRFATGLGSALPNGGGQAMVSVSCPEGKEGSCRGSVSLVPRGQTESELGGGAVASRSFQLAAGVDADLKLNLDEKAVSELPDGPLRLTAVLRSSGASKPVADRPVTVSRPEIYTPPAQASASQALASGSTKFSWDINIPAGKAVVMKDFSCPANAPLVAKGREHVSPGKLVDIVESEGRITYYASDGVGYAGFDRPKVKGTRSINEWTNMTGWPQGGFFSNSIWAPIGKAGKFSLTVICDDVNGLEAARLLGSWDASTAYVKNFFPWKW